MNNNLKLCYEDKGELLRLYYTYNDEIIYCNWFVDKNDITDIINGVNELYSMVKAVLNNE